MMTRTLKLTLCGFCALGVLVMVEPASVQAQSSDRSAAAAAEIRFQQLEKEIRRLTGQMEEQNYEIRRLREEIARLSGDVDVRLRDVAAGGGSAAPAPYVAQATAKTLQPPPSAEVSATRLVEQKKQANSSFQYQPPAAENQRLGTLNTSVSSGQTSSSDAAPRAYDFAYSFIKARDFDRAEKEFGTFIQTYPAHPLVSNAKYWYGETFYVRGNYDKSARVFAEGYQQFPKAPKAASNLLKLGMSLKGMGKTDDACVALKQLKKEYQNSSVPVLKRADTEMKSINCR